MLCYGMFIFFGASIAHACGFVSSSIMRRRRRSTILPPPARSASSATLPLGNYSRTHLLCFACFLLGSIFIPTTACEQHRAPCHLITWLTSDQDLTPTYTTLATILQQDQTLANRHLQTSDQELTPACATLATI